jgi:hypothetical protein
MRFENTLWDRTTILFTPAMGKRMRIFRMYHLLNGKDFGRMFGVSRGTQEEIEETGGIYKMVTTRHFHEAVGDEGFAFICEGMREAMFPERTIWLRYHYLKDSKKGRHWPARELYSFERPKPGRPPWER